MPLYHESKICVESWMEMAREVPVRHEVDRLNEQATLYFGAHEDYVLTLGRKNLHQFVDLATKAITELEAETDEIS
ncbi:MAG: hypothetical protein ACREP9_15170 [Candidatus Dormibacteraceae bacterium]